MIAHNFQIWWSKDNFPPSKNISKFVRVAEKGITPPANASDLFAQVAQMGHYRYCIQKMYVSQACTFIKLIGMSYRSL